eukprot:246591-Karenia_brevis.AAC.1
MSQLEVFILDVISFSAAMAGRIFIMRQLEVWILDVTSFNAVISMGGSCVEAFRRGHLNVISFSAAMEG